MLDHGAGLHVEPDAVDADCQPQPVGGVHRVDDRGVVAVVDPVEEGARALAAVTLLQGAGRAEAAVPMVKTVS